MVRELTALLLKPAVTTSCRDTPGSRPGGLQGTQELWTNLCKVSRCHCGCEVPSLRDGTSSLRENLRDQTVKLWSRQPGTATLPEPPVTLTPEPPRSLSDPVCLGVGCGHCLGGGGNERGFGGRPRL